MFYLVASTQYPFRGDTEILEIFRCSDVGRRPILLPNAHWKIECYKQFKFVYSHDVSKHQAHTQIAGFSHYSYQKLHLFCKTFNIFLL